MPRRSSKIPSSRPDRGGNPSIGRSPSSAAALTSSVASRHPKLSLLAIQSVWDKIRQALDRVQLVLLKEQHLRQDVSYPSLPQQKD